MTGRSQIGTAAAIVAGGVLLSRILGFGRDVAMAVILGRSAEADLYQHAFAIPDFAFYLVAGGFLSITLIPILAHHVENEESAAVNQSFSAVFRTVSAILGVITLTAMLATGPLVDLIFPEVTGETARRLVTMTRLALVLQVLFALGALFSAVQFTHRRFLIPTLGPIVYNAGIITGGVIGNATGNPSPEAFLLGGLAGAFIGSFGLQWWGARRLGLRLVPVGRNHPAVREYLTMAVPLMVGQTVIALDEQWPRIFGQFGPDGTTAGLQYGRRLMMLPVGVIAQAAGVAAYPFLARLAARADETGLRQTVDRSVRAAVVIAVPVTFVVVLLSEVWVRIALQYGAFTSGDTRIVASLLGIYALATPFWVVHQVITRAFYARRRMWTPVVVGTGITAVTVPALFAARGGGTGIAAISACAVAVYAITIALVWYQQAPVTERRAMAEFCLRVVGAAGTAAGAAIAVRVGIGDIAATAVALAVFGGVGYLLKIEEIPAMTRRVLRPR